MYSKTFKVTALSAFIVLSTASFGGIAVAGGSHGSSHGASQKSGGHSKKESRGHAMSIGEAGDPAKVDRTITVIMGDNYYEQESISVKKGETIRFILRNDGEFLHEFNIGTPAMHAEHQKEMAMMAEHGMITATSVDHSKMKMDHGGGKAMMAHDDPNSVLLEPGKQSEIIWHFSNVAELEYGCNVPGHYDSGMVGDLKVQGKSGHSG
jgi:uncharacterized cupredoxin-like copper-binding protein